MPLLELRDVSARYGSIAALHSVSLAVEEGEIAAVLGANGAGKTTTLRAISGTVRRSGDVLFAGRPVPRSPEAAARSGIAHVPEGRGTFAELTVWENLRLGAYMQPRAEFDRALVYFPWLAERRDQQAGTLSGGEQQMLALARARLTRPRLIMLDEPSLGLAPLVVREIFDALAKMNADGTTIVVVEQNANLALEHAARAYVLEVGRIVLAGPSDELRKDESVRRAYLGY